MDKESIKTLLIIHWPKLLIAGIIILTVIFIKVIPTDRPSQALTSEELSSVEKVGETATSEESQTSKEEGRSVSSSIDSNSKIIVDVKGHVNKPGIYEVDHQARLNDVIKLAGGLTSEADPNSVNLAQKLTDEMIIYVASKEEDINLAFKQIEESKVESGANSVDRLININTASSMELQELNGIGQAKAEAIISHREDQGYFDKIEDIQQVSGIGQKSFENLKDSITVE